MENKDIGTVEMEPRQKVLIINCHVDKKPYLSIAEGTFGVERSGAESFDNLQVDNVVRDPSDPENLAKKPGKARLLLPFERIDDFQAVIITGSQLPPTPLERKDGGFLVKEWKWDLYKFIREAERKNKPMLGICFGAEIITEALGGKVEDAIAPSGKKKWEIGWTKVRKLPAGFSDPVLEGLPDEFLVPQNHDLTVMGMPEGAVALLENDNGLQAFKIGRLYGVQFHPEKSYEDMERYLKSEKTMERLAKRNKSVDDLLEVGKQYEGEAKQILQNFLKFAWSNAQ